MKKVTYIVVFLFTIVILIPSAFELFTNLNLIPKQTDADPDNTLKIAVIAKEQDHNASEKQWFTVKSAANYFLSNKVKQNRFTLQGNEFQLEEIYENSGSEYLCKDSDSLHHSLKDVIAILGPITSNCARDLLNTLDFDIPIITSFATSTKLSNKNPGFFFRTVPDDSARMQSLLQQWNPNMFISSNDKNLIVYKGGNDYSEGLLTIVKDYIGNNHEVYEVDINQDLEPFHKIKYNTIFILINPKKAKDQIEELKREQYFNHRQNKPKFVVVAEKADPALFDTPGSLVAMTPTLVSYNSEKESMFLNVEKEQLKDRSSSTFIAFEALFRALEYSSNYKVKGCLKEPDEVSVFRCSILSRLKQPFISDLIGNELSFKKNTGNIKTNNLVSAEVLKLGTRFNITHLPLNLPPLIGIDIDAEQKSMWLGSPMKIALSSSHLHQVTLNFNYSAPDWITHPEIRNYLSKKLSIKESLDSQGDYEFHPRFMGTYNLQLGGLGNDFRQSAGKHTIESSAPTLLFYIILISFAVTVIILKANPGEYKDKSKVKLFNEAFLSSILLFLVTVTLRGYNFPIAPVISFSDNPLTNVVYCGILAGSIRLHIFNYFIEPIVKRFARSQQADQPNHNVNQNNGLANGVIKKLKVN